MCTCQYFHIDQIVRSTEWLTWLGRSILTHSPDTRSQLRRVIRYQLVYLLSGTADDGQTLRQGCLERHGAAHGFTSPERHPERSMSIQGDATVHTCVCVWNTLHLHFSDGVPNATKLGELVDAFFFDDRAVHIKADGICSPEELLCL